MLITPSYCQTKTLNPPQKLQGLNAPVVLSAIKDSMGFMWFYTLYGLVRYDGYNFKTYNNDPKDSTSMPGIVGISKMIEDADGKIWLGTAQNLLLEFDPVKEKFTSYAMDSTISENYRNWISTMYLDHDHNLWLGLQYEGFYKFNPKEKSFKLYRQQTIEPIHNKDFVTSFIELDSNQMLFGTWEGLYILDKRTDSIKPFTLGNTLPKGFGKATFSSLIKDPNGAIWLGSDIGLFKFITDEDTIIWFNNQPDNSPNLWSNIIQHLYLNPLDGGQSIWIVAWNGIDRAEMNQIDINTGIVQRFANQPEKPANVYDYYVDDSGLLWMATDNQGVFFIDLKNNPFQHFDIKTNTAEEENFSGSAFYTDIKGDFWVGTGQGGLFRYDESGKLKKRYLNLPGSIYSIPTMIYDIFEDSKNNMWISYWSDGVYQYNRRSGKFKRFDMQHPLADVPLSRASELLEDSFGRLWIGSLAGPFYTDLDQENIVQLNPINDPVLRASHVRSICEDKNRSVWVTTDRNGLFCLTPENRDSLKFINYQHQPGIDGSISSNEIMSVCCADDGTLWIGTGNGLNHFDNETNTFEYFSFNNGFDAYFVYCVRTDESGNIWVSTEKGIARFKPDAEEGKKFKLFSERDGLPIDKIYPYHFDKGKDGRFYFGGERGFGLGYFSFHPDSIKDNTLVPPIAMSSFKVKNKPIELDTAIPYKKHIRLQYDQNYISFEFASLDYNDPEMNKYSYKLDGLDEEWVYSNNRNFANYTGIAPGEYTFNVRGSNNDGIWNEASTQIHISIASPPWRTWWAYLLYFLILSSIIFIVIRLYLRRQHLMHKLELEHLNTEKLKELDTLKSNFFANISHEFRTPLTLILGPIQKLRQALKGKSSTKDLDMLERNALQLKGLINQILDLSKLEAGKLELKTEEVNMVQFVKSYIQSFESLARQNNIDFNFHADEDTIYVFIDKDKLEQIINNLISNAFKHTSDGGKIQTSISIDTFPDSEKDAAKIDITDTGKGISEEDIPYLFDRFYQAHNHTENQGGSGIGLTLVKELIELHQGVIHVSSKPDEGSTFSLFLLLGSGHLLENEIIKSHTKEVLSSKGSTEAYKSNENGSDPLNFDAPTLLIVEDNADMRSYIHGHFNDSYQIVEAFNGKDGFEKAVQYIPDMIVSDVMMPEMNGNELCELLKSDERTSHIPVILLTARSSGADKIEGLETGADDFMTKPFDAKELHVRIKNLITQRQKLGEYYKSQIATTERSEDLFGKTELTNEMEEKFLKKALAIVEAHISDENFNVESFAIEMAFSRMQLHRKLKSLTGQSATEFIRTFRLNKAAKLLVEKSGNVSEIAYQVGFNSLSWFTKCFKEQYGMSPSEFSQE